MQLISSPGFADQTLNKSRFIAVAQYCADERAVMRLLRQLANEHSHAHHLAFAYKVQNPDGGYGVRFHDAGEPSGTAGKPILQYIEGRDLVNVCVAVVRYFGGIKLGAGGLARAYGGTAKLALDAAKLTPFVEMRRIELQLEYAQWDSFMRDLEKLSGEVLDKRFGERVSVTALLPAAQAANVLHRYGGI